MEGVSVRSVGGWYKDKNTVAIHDGSFYSYYPLRAATMRCVKLCGWIGVIILFWITWLVGLAGGLYECVGFWVRSEADLLQGLYPTNSV